MPRLASTRRGGGRIMWLWGALAIVLVLWGAMAVWQRYKPLPEGIGQAHPERRAVEARLLVDETWYDDSGQRHLDQAIFDEVLAMIGQARRLIVMDMFLFNDFAGDAAEDADFVPLSSRLTDALVEQRSRYPDLEAVVITDPLNTVYGGLALEHLERLREAGIKVVMTDLDRLRASNPLWSGLWHLGIDRLGNDPEGGWLPNAMGYGRVTLRSYLALLNFRANHRKTLVVDQGDGWAGLVTSANPHDASSLHDNLALRFEGPAALDLLASECPVAAWAGVTLPGPPPPAPSSEPEGATLRVLTEGAIRDALLQVIRDAAPGDRLDVAVFYLSHRPVIDALIEARQRGVTVRVLLDANREAFGIKKGGIPNRPVAEELAAADVEVRWCVTRGEQCHTKLLLHRPAAGHDVSMILGSANYTRRNLDDLNLETNVGMTGPATQPALADAIDYVERQWRSTPARTTSREYTEADDVGPMAWWRYRLMEASGLSTF
ncbi:phospholipase D-like domain-containing protein [Halomonas elongata]|uniref:Phospholipase D-like domain-containing protein n=1 Tax=Halomonas elongata (strain ATCC 33173 / DSM 2581 / NBRC 15536 / NCIMB 2198 / 1H9) TaxID=768066 RepID=E1VBA7_HALED|nr:phospholipase D-like domain-containing protein [Halomonas elongata]WBF19437.1 phospholipase D-like domain-containing protein [Halomonas elongata]WPU48298.1 phospholipase D-like domain-containing protein [Halomonas elongata DSM 2581]CBV42168.1 phospholipase domain protein [Halomonas elongata DSM 2581]